jgi:transcriptional regulator with XRE-family HTH domain/cation transport regulator ChaB
MPIGLSKAPETLPETAKKLWVDTFNGVFDSCNGTQEACDKAAVGIAWRNVKKKFHKNSKGVWVPMTTKSDMKDDDNSVIVRADFTISKASMSPGGALRWACSASDTGQDRAGEAASVTLFRDWMDRITGGIITPWLAKPPRLPFLGLSHYPDLGGLGEAGITERMYIDGDVFKATGIFHSDSASHPLGEAAFEAIKKEKALVKKSGSLPDNPIRISAAWYDLCHSHGDYVFVRRSFSDRCPLCRAGELEDKVYLKGQLDHFALTRVPMNPRTQIELLTEKSMTTRKEDAESIIENEELVESLDRAARLTGKSDAVLVVMSGGFGKRLAAERKKKKMTHEDLEKQSKVSTDIIKALEEEDEETGVTQSQLKRLAKAIDMDDEELEGFLKKPKTEEKEEKASDKKKPAFLKGKEEDDDDEAETSKREGKKKRPSFLDDIDEDDDEKAKAKKGPGAVVAVSEETVQAMRPFGGAITMKDAFDWVKSQQKKQIVASNFDTYLAVLNNVETSPEVPSDKKEAAKAQVTREFADTIEALKSAVTDAYLISPVGKSIHDEDEAEIEQEFELSEEPEQVEADDFEEYLADMNDAGINSEHSTSKGAIMSDQEQEHRVTDELENIYLDVMSNPSLSVEERKSAIQAGINAFAEKASSALEEIATTPEERQAKVIVDAVANAVAAAMEPVNQQLALMAAKSEAAQSPTPTQTPNYTDMSVAQEPVFQVPQGIASLNPPVQKSVARESITAPQQDLSISPITGKPSALRQQLIKTVQQ